MSFVSQLEKCPKQRSALTIALIVVVALLVAGIIAFIVYLSMKPNPWSLVSGDTRPRAAGVLGVTGMYGSPSAQGFVIAKPAGGAPEIVTFGGVPAGGVGGAAVGAAPTRDGCPPLGVEYAPHSNLVPPFQRATQGLDQPHMNDHPLEAQARAVHAGLYNNRDLPCYEPADRCYDPAQSLLTETPSLVAPYQQRLKDLPAVRPMALQQENAATGFGQNTRQSIDTLSSTTMDKENTSDMDSMDSRVVQTAGAGNGLAGIYGRGDTKGISMINQKSRMTDPSKMLPRADPAQEQHRMVQAGPSIADIACRVPKAADLMRMMRGGSSVLSNTIPRDRPPVYTTGLNAFRPTRLPARTVNADCLLGISPQEISDIIDYRPNPFLSGSRGAGAPYAYAVPGTK